MLNQQRTGRRVNGAKDVIQQVYISMTVDCTGKGNPMLLTTRQVDAAFADLGGVATEWCVGPGTEPAAADPCLPVTHSGTCVGGPPAAGAPVGIPGGAKKSKLDL